MLYRFKCLVIFGPHTIKTTWATKLMRRNSSDLPMGITALPTPQCSLLRIYWSNLMGIRVAWFFSDFFVIVDMFMMLLLQQFSMLLPWLRVPGPRSVGIFPLRRYIFVSFYIRGTWAGISHPEIPWGNSRNYTQLGMDLPHTSAKGHCFDVTVLMLSVISFRNGRSIRLLYFPAL